MPTKLATTIGKISQNAASPQKAKYTKYGKFPQKTPQKTAVFRLHKYPKNGKIFQWTKKLTRAIEP
jgi:hypothetical protein